MTDSKGRDLPYVELNADETFLLRRSAQMVKEDPVAAKEAFRAAAACLNCNTRHRTITYEQCVDRKMTEKTLQDRVRARAKTRGWTIAHAGKGWIGDKAAGTLRMVTQMAPGFPDLMFLKPGMKYPVFFAELKRQEGELEAEQITWLNLLNACGIPAIVLRPSDLREGRVNLILEGK